LNTITLSAGAENKKNHHAGGCLSECVRTVTVLPLEASGIFDPPSTACDSRRARQRTVRRHWHSQRAPPGRVELREALASVLKRFSTGSQMILGPERWGSAMRGGGFQSRRGYAMEPQVAQISSRRRADSGRECEPIPVLGREIHVRQSGSHENESTQGAHLVHRPAPVTFNLNQLAPCPPPSSGNV
jgi:hypothetical protein